jgi:hypothetical protein
MKISVVGLGKLGSPIVAVLAAKGYDAPDQTGHLGREFPANPRLDRALPRSIAMGRYE